MKPKRTHFRAMAAAVSLVVSAGAALAADGPMIAGEVKELRPGGELTIKHAPIPNLDMGAMTMVFKTKDPKLGKGLKVGDKIKFHAEDVGGKLTIMHLEKAK